jgi:hypothetical protein
MAQLVVCPDCGKPTHPLASEILAAAKDGPPAGRSLSAEPIERHCENCGRKIGRLESLQVWENHLVCVECHGRLVNVSLSERKSQTSLSAPAAAAASTPAVTEDVPVATPKSRKLRGLPAAAPTPAENTTVALPKHMTPAGSNVPTIVIDSPLRAIPVSVNRAAEPATTAANHGKPTVFKHRLVMLLAIVFVAGAAMYGALTLLRDLMGILTLIAFGLMAVGAGFLLVRIGLTYLKRRFAAWRSKPSAGSTELVVKRD